MLFLYGWERTAGSGATIVGTWEFVHRSDATTELNEGGHIRIVYGDVGNDHLL